MPESRIDAHFRISLSEIGVKLLRNDTVLRITGEHLARPNNQTTEHVFMQRDVSVPRGVDGRSIVCELRNDGRLLSCRGRVVDPAAIAYEIVTLPPRTQRVNDTLPVAVGHE